MADNTKICKICGKEYPACTTIIKGVFRWQDVACCPEHASEYFALVAAARGETKAEPKKEEPVVKEVKEETVKEVEKSDSKDKEVTKKPQGVLKK